MPTIVNINIIDSVELKVDCRWLEMVHNVTRLAHSVGNIIGQKHFLFYVNVVESVEGRTDEDALCLTPLGPLGLITCWHL